jgi:hypothetical protein
VTGAEPPPNRCFCFRFQLRRPSFCCLQPYSLFFLLYEEKFKQSRASSANQTKLLARITMATFLPLWRISFSLLALACIYESVAGSSFATMNLTVTVPAGSSNHGLANYICTPTQWYDFIIFFGANFFAHAATIRTIPGEKSSDIALTVTLALLFPFSGISRGVEAIARHASWPPCDELTRAARSGALCTVVRGREWKLRDGMTLEGLQVPSDESSKVAFNYVIPWSHQHGLTVQDFWHKAYNYSTVTLGQSRTITGEPGLLWSQKTYRLAILPSNTLVKPRSTRTLAQDNPQCKVSSSYNVPQVIISVVQLIFALVTLYRTRGDQLNKYGYSAFGLTVLPYFIMSLFNLVGNIVTPTYSNLYLVHSRELEEFGRFYKTDPPGEKTIVLDGTLGCLTQERHTKINFTSDPLQWLRHAPSRRLPNQYTVKLATPSSHEALPPAIVSQAIREIGCPIHSNAPGRQNWILTPVIADDDGLHSDNYLILPSDPLVHTLPTIYIPSHLPFELTPEPERWSHGSVRYWLSLSVVILSALPYSIIGILTGFRAGQSTLTQRFFTMYWLAAGILVGAILPFSKVNVSSFRQILYDMFPPVFRSEYLKIGWLFVILLTSSAAIGGFVVVGQMLKEYGTCTMF